MGSIEAFEIRRLYVSSLRCMPTVAELAEASHPIWEDHINTSCFWSAPQQSRTCLPPPLDMANHVSIVLTPISYFAISIHVSMANGRGAAVRPHHSDPELS